MTTSRNGLAIRARTRTIGVLALQGDFERHRAKLAKLGAAVQLVRSAAALETIDALVIPGGESTAMSTLLGTEDLARLRLFAASRPVFGTCAGAILLAREIEGSPPALGAMDISVRRNAYGRQIDSSIRTSVLDGAPTELVFIRAPRIVRVGPEVDVLVRDGADPVLVRQGHLLAATFHPELGDDDRVHALFLQIVDAAAAGNAA